MGDLSIGDLFPPPGHRYLTEERIEELRQEALPGHDLTVSVRTVMELVCDWRNAAAESADLVAEVERKDAEIERLREAIQAWVVVATGEPDERLTIRDGYPFWKLDPENVIDRAIVQAWNRAVTDGGEAT